MSPRAGCPRCGSRVKAFNAVTCKKHAPKKRIGPIERQLQAIEARQRARKWAA